MSFRAKFEGGFCPADCGSRIHEGDMVEYVDDELVHAECTPQRDPLELRLREVVCPDCFTVRPCRCVE